MDWKINIEVLADNVADKYGKAVAESVFKRVGARCFDDLSPTQYEEVFSDLMLIDADD